MLITIKTKKPEALGQADSFLREVRKRASGILASKGDRVLVVFGKKEASIYYERNALPRGPRKTGNDRGPKAA